jgi:phosphate transport system substrate-binding protein
MIFGTNGNNRMTKLAGALVLTLVAASSAHAAIQVGGGATLPALGYVGNVTHRLNSAPTSTSLFGAYKSVFANSGASYCQTGSGAGKNILAGVSGTSVQNGCPDGSATPTGFGATTVGRTTLTQPDFAASDSPLSTGDYNNYVANRGTSRPLQFPAVAGGIAVVYRNDKSTTKLNLSTAQVCGIFNGSITTWSALGQPLPASGVDALQVVYRSDGSGTSFGLSNFLSANCPVAVGAPHFITDQSFSTAVSQFSLPGATWSGQSGNANVVNAIVNGTTDGFIGYAEAANALAVAGNMATVNSKSPTADLGDATNHQLAISSADVVYNNAISGVDSNGRPIVSPISGAPSTSCIALVKPDSYATLSSTVSGYPIVAVSYLLGNSQGNGTDAADVRNLLGAPYNASVIAATKTIGVNKGLVFLSGSPISQTQINGCVIN